jgi:uncharacterized membrane protein HdeD (DUF308 family)
MRITTEELTETEIAAGDVQAAELERKWWWYLVAGVVGVLLGFVVLSWRTETIYVLTYFAGAVFLFAGVFRIFTGIVVPAARALSLVSGVILLALGVIILVWPQITLFVLALLIALGFVLWGVIALIGAFSDVHARHWWIALLIGIASLVIGIWAVRHPGDALNLLIILLGVWIILWGVMEIVTAFVARHARRHWNDIKKRAA